MYRGDVSMGPEAVLALFQPLESSMLMRVSTVRAIALWLKGRMLLLCGDRSSARARLRMVERLAKKLRQGGTTYTDVWSGLMLAAVHSARGESELAKQELKLASAVGDEAAMKLVAAAARYRLGQLTGGSEGVQLTRAADQQLRAESIVAPERFLRVLAPGFSEPNMPKLLGA